MLYLYLTCPRILGYAASCKYSNKGFVYADEMSESQIINVHDRKSIRGPKATNLPKNPVFKQKYDNKNSKSQPLFPDPIRKLAAITEPKWIHLLEHSIQCSYLNYV